jgi:hypothetical protein
MDANYYCLILLLIIIFGMTAPHKPQPSLEVKDAGYSFFGFHDNSIFKESVNTMLNAQLGGPSLHICDPQRQGDPTIPPGTGYLF